jgi:uncharacterized SAM-dependent methyltransferase
MIGTIATQLLKKIANEMVIAKMRPIPLLEMGSETCQHTKRAFRHLRELGPKSILKTYMRDELKEVN